VKIEHNNITIPSGAVNHGVIVFGSGTLAPLKALLDGNTITNNGQFDGIHVNTSDANTTPTMNVTVTNNTVNSADLSGLSATISINCNFRRADTGTFKIEGNTTTSANSGNGIQLRRTLGTVRLERGGSASNTPSVVLAANNPAATGTGGAINVVTDGTILPAALLFAPGGVERAEAGATVEDLGLRGAPSSVSDSATTRAVTLPAIREAGLAVDKLQTPAVQTAATVPLSKAATAHDVLTQAQLDGVVSAALARWEATGLTKEQFARLRSVTFEVADLPGWYLGEAAGSHIRVDDNAGGNGWHVDASPESDALFGTGRLRDAPLHRSRQRTRRAHRFAHRRPPRDGARARTRGFLPAAGWRQHHVWPSHQGRTPPAAHRPGRGRATASEWRDAFPRRAD
jgi:hypothetical protein